MPLKHDQSSGREGEGGLRAVKDYYSDGRHGRRGCKEPIPDNAIEGDRCNGCLFPILASDGDRQPPADDGYIRVDIPF